MTAILGGLVLILFLCSKIVATAYSKGGENTKNIVSSFFPDEKNNADKRQFEIWALKYTVVWIGAFGYIILSDPGSGDNKNMWNFRNFDANMYMKVCVSLSLPYLLQPIVSPVSAEKHLPLYQRYSFKANVWIAIFSFIGNYWYTHYFYGVLGATYTFPAKRLNDVPICLYFATHFYFVTYHTAANMILRKIETTYVPNAGRKIFTWIAILAFSYFTAFMETLTISGFDKYCFKVPIHDIYVKGSAFYGIYFIVSYPVFYNVDEKAGSPKHSLYQVVMESMGAGMLVLLLLDFCRLYMGKDFNAIKGEHAFYDYRGPQ